MSKMRSITIFIIIALIVVAIWMAVWNNDKTVEKHNNRVQMGEIVRIDGIEYSIEKRTLANGKCYHVYTGSYRSFTIPCE